MYYSKYYCVIQDIAESMTIVVDTREQQTLRLRDRLRAFSEMDLDVERRALSVGDYSAYVTLPNGKTLDFCNMISIERKMDVDELMSCFIQEERTRFEKELKRAQDMKCVLHCVTEDGCYDDLLNENYKRKISSQRALGTYHAFEKRYQVHFGFTSRQAFPRYVFETLRRFIIDYLLENEKIVRDAMREATAQAKSPDKKHRSRSS